MQKIWENMHSSHLDFVVTRLKVSWSQLSHVRILGQNMPKSLYEGSIRLSLLLGYKEGCSFPFPTRNLDWNGAPLKMVHLYWQMHQLMALDQSGAPLSVVHFWGWPCLVPNSKLNWCTYYGGVILEESCLGPKPSFVNMIIEMKCLHSERTLGVFHCE